MHPKGVRPKEKKISDGWEAIYQYNKHQSFKIILLRSRSVRDEQDDKFLFKYKNEKIFKIPIKL